MKNYQQTEAQVSWGYGPEILALGGRRILIEFKTILGCIVRPCLKAKTEMELFSNPK